jgi:hypothetical protein
MDKDRQLQNDIKQAFDRQALDPGTSKALKTARMAALEQETRGAIPRWIPATALSCLLVIMIGILVSRSDNPAELPQMTADELAVIASEDELELFEELEFYIWYDEEKNV